jgi:hypothetical protein
VVIIVVILSPASVRPGSYHQAVPAERVRLRIGNLAKAVLVSGQAYQDPKDALNEFVSNAADEYVEGDLRGRRIRIVLRRKGRYPAIAIDDNGRGMSPDRLREVARNLFESSKAGDDRTLGEKAIGILAFQQLGGRCEIVSRRDDAGETWALRLERGRATAALERERRRARTTAGTTVYLTDLDPDVLRVLTQRKVVDYLRARRGPALARNEFEIEVVEGRSSELVLPERPEGVRLNIPARSTLWGRIEFSIFVTPKDGRHRRVAVVGRAGATILDDLAELEEFAGEPWNSDQVSGQVAFAALQQTAGRRAILRDRDAFPIFVDAIENVAPIIGSAVERIAREVDADTADRLTDEIRRIFGRVLRELSDLDNPMRTATGFEVGGDAVLLVEGDGESSNPSTRESVGLDDLLEPTEQPVVPRANLEGAVPAGAGRSRLPTIAPDPSPGDARSRFDAESGVVLYNEGHPDYLTIKDSRSLLLDYLAMLVAKEYVIYNNPRADPEELGEELVRMLVRVRRHLPKRI